MLDQSTSKGRIIAATMRLAAERAWREVTLLDIAEAADLTLADVRRDFSDKGGILAAFTRAIDDEVLAKPRGRTSNTGVRDALFEVIMERFDALAPYRAALRSIRDSGGGDLSMLRALIASQAWMLRAAGVGTDGLSGPVKVLGLASVYGSVFRTWLEDDDPGLARTMAALDRNLRRGESTMQTFDDAVRMVDRITGLFWGNSRRTGSSTAPGSSGASADGAGPTPPPPQPQSGPSPTGGGVAASVGPISSPQPGPAPGV